MPEDAPAAPEFESKGESADPVSDVLSEFFLDLQRRLQSYADIVNKLEELSREGKLKDSTAVQNLLRVAVAKPDEAS